MTWSRLLAAALAIGLAASASCTHVQGGGTGGASSTTSTTSTGGASTSATTTTSSSTGTGGEAPDAGAIVCKVGYTTIPKGGPCDLLNQNCPVGQTCEPSQFGGSWTTTCVATPGLKQANEPCYTPSECDAKLICVGGTGKQAGTCVAFCCPDATNLPCNGGICNEQVDFGGGTTAFVCSYGKQCELLTPSACPAGYDCHLEAAAGMGVAICFEPSPTPMGELGSCLYINDCGDMQECYQPNNPNGGTCLYYCALTGPKTGQPPGLGGCGPNEKCLSSYQGQAISLGIPNVGLCIPNGGLGQMMDAGTDAGSGDAGDDAAADAGAAGNDDGGDAGIDDGGGDG